MSASNGGAKDEIKHFTKLFEGYYKQKTYQLAYFKQRKKNVKIN